MLGVSILWEVLLNNICRFLEETWVSSFLCLQVLCLRDTYSAKVLAPLQGLTLDALDIINQFMTTQMFIGWDDLFVPCKISSVAVWSCRMIDKSIDLNYFFLLIIFLICWIWYMKCILPNLIRIRCVVWSLFWSSYRGKGTLRLASLHRERSPWLPLITTVDYYRRATKGSHSTHISAFWTKGMSAFLIFVIWDVP